MKSHGARIARWAVAALGALAAVQELGARLYYRRTEPPVPRFVEDERTAWTPAWREALAPFEWLAASARSRTPAGVPRGVGDPVLLVPGFLMTSHYLAPLARWLGALGYAARAADVGWNADCFDAVANDLLADVRATHQRTGRRVHLVGHSLGGALARAAAVRAPDAIASVATLGAPLRGLRLNPGLRAAAAVVRAGIHRRRDVPDACATFACPCDTVRALATEPPPRVPLLTLATRDDGVADWRYALDPLATRTATVRGSHTGLVFNLAVYEALARHLADARARAAA